MDPLDVFLEYFYAAMFDQSLISKVNRAGESVLSKKLLWERFDNASRVTQDVRGLFKPISFNGIAKKDLEAFLLLVTKFAGHPSRYTLKKHNCWRYDNDLDNSCEHVIEKLGKQFHDNLYELCKKHYSKRCEGLEFKT